MKNKLHNLPSIMEEGVFKGRGFTEESKENVRNRIGKNDKHHLPNFLTIAVTCGFLGLGTFYVAQETGFLKDDPIYTSNENVMPMVNESPLDLNGDLPPEKPLMINDELINSLSLPLEIQSAVPSVSSKPIMSAQTISDGYSVSLTFPGEGFEVNMIEVVEPPENIEQYKKKRVSIWSDEKQVKVNGFDAFYSVNQKELQFFTKEKYFTIHGVEEEQLLSLALMIDTNKPVQQIELEEYKDVIMDNVDPAEIKQKVYLPNDFHKNVDYLSNNKDPIITAEQNETAFTLHLGYTAPEDSSELMIEQHYNENGNSHRIEQIHRTYTLEKEVDLKDRKILLLSNGFHHAGYFTYQNNLFEVRTMNSVSLEHVQEILSAVDVSK